MKIKLLVIFIFLTVVFNVNANNDLTKVGVVDVSEVYTRFSKESTDARKFDEYKSKIEDEISKRKIEIDNIDKNLIDARDNDDQELVAELESKLQISKINLQNYVRYKNNELRALISSDSTKGDFSDRLQDAMKEVALQNGISIIMHKDDPKMLWYSPDVDITELVIEKIMN
ncbi:MAG: OmpH family outer membrane protein [Spirochaetaceae bacterium]